MRISTIACVSRLFAACLSAALTLWADAQTASAAEPTNEDQAAPDSSVAKLARPSPQQYAWHEQERIQFACLDPCTWQGREYDNHSTPLSAINPTQLDTDQWCRAAKLWGAKEILFVAKHTGGFCWWRTDTTTYSIKEAAWKGGQGDVLAELSASCRKHGLNLGIYVYPGDDTWGAPSGSGGRTKDLSKQEADNKVFRQQLTEVLTRYGKITEVWFDGSCVIDVSDILRQHAADAVIFQGPQATIRWPGTESGKLPYPAWNSLLSKDLKTGGRTPLRIAKATLLYEGEEATPGLLTRLAARNTFNVNRTAQVTKEASSVLQVKIAADGGTDCSGVVWIRPRPDQ